MGSITSANAIFMIAVPPLFPVPQQLQGFMADDIFDTEPLESAEVVMGADGVMSAGFVFVPVRQQVAIQADSRSNDLFDQWYQAQQTIKDTYRASGIIVLTSISKKWTMTNGVLSSYQPLPNAKRTLEGRRHRITWEKVEPAAA